MKDEARAIEHKKREEAKAEQNIRVAEVHFSFYSSFSKWRVVLTFFLAGFTCVCDICSVLLWKVGYAILQVKADKIIANAKEEAIKMKAHSAEQCEKAIADAHTQAERVSATTLEDFHSFSPF